MRYNQNQFSQKNLSRNLNFYAISSFIPAISVVLGCSQSAAQNCTYVESSGAGAGSCKTTICKCNSNICQVTEVEAFGLKSKIVRCSD